MCICMANLRLGDSHSAATSAIRARQPSRTIIVAFLCPVCIISGSEKGICYSDSRSSKCSSSLVTGTKEVSSSNREPSSVSTDSPTTPVPHSVPLPSRSVAETEGSRKQVWIRLPAPCTVPSRL